MTFSTAPYARTRLNVDHSNKYTYVTTTEYLTQLQIDRLPQDEKSTIGTIKDKNGKPILPVLQSDGRTFKVTLKRKFANYASIQDGIRDYLELIQEVAGYKKAYDEWVLSDLPNRDEILIKGIVQQGYATSPLYLDLMLRVYKQLKSIIKIPGEDKFLAGEQPIT